jgi:hypothetical protein
LNIFNKEFNVKTIQFLLHELPKDNLNQWMKINIDERKKSHKFSNKIENAYQLIKGKQFSIYPW